MFIPEPVCVYVEQSRRKGQAPLWSGPTPPTPGEQDDGGHFEGRDLGEEEEYNDERW